MSEREISAVNRGVVHIFTVILLTQVRRKIETFPPLTGAVLNFCQIQVAPSSKRYLFAEVVLPLKYKIHVKGKSKNAKASKMRRSPAAELVSTPSLQPFFSAKERSPTFSFQLSHIFLSQSLLDSSLSPQPQRKITKDPPSNWICQDAIRTHPSANSLFYQRKRDTISP